ncbi:MAG: replication-associated recombination protein A [Firmicutes bacterium]|nr:replication-associated recombination protein A [Bacillota bacterium]
MPPPERRGQRTLFDPGPPGGGEPAAQAPLAARMRPRTLGEFEGQEAAVGPDTALMRAVAAGEMPSLILWGPPGCGKTTLAGLLAQAWGARLVALSAVSAGVADVRRVVEEARAGARRGERTVLFLDEIHRFSRAQQDAILPHVENGVIRLVGATTENPSFEVNGALLSRCLVVRLAPLAPEAVARIVRRALEDDERGLGGRGIELTPEGERALVEAAAGDARVALGALEVAAAIAARGVDGRRRIGRAEVGAALMRRLPRHDRAGDAHYDTISAFIKSVRGSDADAAVYWLARLLEAGEDPLFVARRLVLLAAEDVGLADPSALPLAQAAYAATHAIGMPEAYLPLAEATLYLALAPKSNSAYTAYSRAREAALARPDEPVPLHLRNAPTALMRAAGYGQGYRYAHDEPDGVAPQRHLPEALADEVFYRPGGRGAEAALGERWRELRRRLREQAPPAGGARREDEGTHG